MALRNSVIPAAFAFAGCLASESEPPPSVEQVVYQTPVEGGACEVEEIVHRVRGAVFSEDIESGDKSALREERLLLVTVAESSSVVDCGEDIVRIARPGAELVTAAFDPGSESFALDVPADVIGGHRPSIWVRALLDENGNGRCDDGEPVAAVEVDEGELGDLALALSRDGCPTRL